jgi:hypothetical protein
MLKPFSYWRTELCEEGLRGFIGQLYQRRVEQLSHLLSDESRQQEAVTIIRSLIEPDRNNTW